MATVYLALGSNLGDRLANLQRATTSLPPSVRVIAQSPVYETEPWGYLEQATFLNQALKAQTGLEPDDLLAYLKKIESQLGRLPSFLNGPRLIDIDILFYDDLVYHSPTLSIPHPRLAERSFVLVPLADLAPDLVHPGTGKTIKDLLSAANTQGVSLYPGPA